jgi:hypothetical protein
VSEKNVDEMQYPEGGDAQSGTDLVVNEIFGPT